MKTKKNTRAEKTKPPVHSARSVKREPAAKSKKSHPKKAEPEFESEELEEVEESPMVLAANVDALPPKGQLERLLLDGIKDIFYAEKLLVKSLLKMGAEATSEELRQTFKDHRVETEDHVSRLEEIFEMLDEKVTSKKCEAIEGITQEVDRMITETRENTLTRDAALILGARKAEHYEIASYSGLIQLARSLGKDEVADLLEDTLDEEKDADKQLASIAENVVFQHAIME